MANHDIQRKEAHEYLCQEKKLRILFQNSSSIFTFRPSVRMCVDKGDIPPYLHYMTF